MLTNRLTRHEIGRVDQATVVPTHKVGPLERAQKKLGSPFGALLQIVGNRTVGSRHRAGGHGERGITVDQRFAGQFRPAVQTGLLYFESSVHLIKNQVGVSAGDGQHGIQRIGVRIDLVTDKQMIRVVAADRVSCRLVVPVNAAMKEDRNEE